MRARAYQPVAFCDMARPARHADRAGQSDAQQVPLLPTVLTCPTAVAITRTGALDPEVLLVRLSARGQLDDIRTWLHKACAAPTPSAYFGSLT